MSRFWNGLGSARSRVALALAATCASLVVGRALCREGHAGVVLISKAPPANPAERPLVELGRRLFFDPAVSHSGTVSCASCHQPEHGYADPLRGSRDDFDTTPRHSQTLLDCASSPRLHWDGEFSSIEDLIRKRLGPMDGPGSSYGPGASEMEGSLEGACFGGTPAFPAVAERIEEEGRYAGGMLLAFGSTEATESRLAVAIAAYTRTLRAARSPYDRHAAGDPDALSPEAKRGLELFRGRAGCAACHRVEGRRAPFTDHAFHDTGITWDRTPGAGPFPARRRFQAANEGPGIGRRQRTDQVEDMRAFKTPTLRDVALRPPYMHDGSLATLEEVVRYYAAGCGSDPILDDALEPFDANDGDIRDLVAFLGALTGERVPGLPETAWSKRAPRQRFRVLDALGRVLRLPVAVEPAGQALPGADTGQAKARRIEPDGEGWISYEPPLSTHVRISFPDNHLRPQGSDTIPDITRETSFVAIAQRSGR